MSDSSAGARIAIVGGGFTGAAVAFHLASQGIGGIVVVEPRERLGGGLAYSSPDPSHRVNVPARRMSLVPADPDDFLRWLEASEACRGDAEARTADGELYPRRAVFGRYVAARLEPFLRRGLVRHERERAVAAERTGEGYGIRLGDGRLLHAGRLVVATTHPPPAVPGPLRPLAGLPGFHPDPYDSEGLAGIGTAERVLIVGTGLAMADTVASLDRRGHRGAIIALSRHGWRSRPHACVAVEPFGDFTGEPARGTVELVRRVRAELAAAAAQGLPWQAVFDALRRQGPDIWAALPHPARARLLRHLRTLWDVHRFRIAPQIEAILRRRLEAGSLAVLAASLRDAAPGAHGFEVQVRPRHAAAVRTLRVDRIVITTGPAHDAVRRLNPLVASLAQAGLVRADALGLGLDTARCGLAVGAAGAPVAGLFVAGPLARATFGELMGLPEVASYAERIAAEVAASLRDGGEEARSSAA